MEDATKPIVDFIANNWGWIVTVFLAFFEITPIKIKPISALCKWIGKKITGSIEEDIKNINERLNETEKAIDYTRMANIKALVLDFANSCRNGRKHSREEFTHILSENDVYESLVKKYDIKNSVYQQDYKFVKDLYQKCLKENSFLA